VRSGRSVGRDNRESSGQILQGIVHGIDWRDAGGEVGQELLIGRRSNARPGAFGGVQRAARLLWRIPALGERMRVFQLARLYRTLGMLLRGGIAIVPALEMVTGLLSVALQARLASAMRKIREGNAISQAFEADGLTTAVALRMLRVGERAGNMGEMMERAAAFHDEEMARWAEWATRLFGPLLMLLMGLVIGAIVVLMYLPIFQLAAPIGCTSRATSRSSPRRSRPANSTPPAPPPRAAAAWSRGSKKPMAFPPRRSWRGWPRRCACPSPGWAN